MGYITIYIPQPQRNTHETIETTNSSLPIKQEQEKALDGLKQQMSKLNSEMKEVIQGLHEMFKELKEEIANERQKIVKGEEILFDDEVKEKLEKIDHETFIDQEVERNGSSEEEVNDKEVDITIAMLEYEEHTNYTISHEDQLKMSDSNQGTMLCAVRAEEDDATNINILLFTGEGVNKMEAFQEFVLQRVGQHGIATVTVSARFGLACIIYMGAHDVERATLNFFRIRLEVKTIIGGIHWILTFGKIIIVFDPGGYLKYQVKIVTKLAC